MAASGVDKSDPLLTMDVVREFMLSKGGKIRNHELVSHFKNFLNDPVRKIANREKIKIFVNTLAVVKLDTSGEKLLTLKKKYRESGNFDGDPTVDTTPAAPQANTKDAAKKNEAASSKLKDSGKKIEGASSKPKNAKDLNKKSQSFDRLTEKTVEVEGAEEYVLISKNEGKSKSLDVPDSEEVEQSTQDPFQSPVPSQDFVLLHANSVSSVEEESAVVATKAVTVEALKQEKPDEVDATASSAEQLLEEKNEEPSSDVASTESADQPDGHQRPFVAPPDQFTTPKSSSATEEPTSGSLSVKEVARSLNKLESDNQGQPRPLALKNKRESRKPPSGDDGSGDYTMTFTELNRDWLMASANCDYMTMSKMLQTNPELAKKRDFITGYAPLHWAAKQGKLDVIKLLCGHGAVVNVRTNGGYTPLHLAAMLNHESVVELLVNAYGADPNIRDYSGKKPKQWIQRSASAQMSQILQSRRTNQGAHTPIEGPKCDSAISKAMSVGFGVLGLRTSPGKENAPKLRPVSCTKDDYELMPPPSGLPPVLRAKPVIRQKDVHSDSEMSNPLPENKIHSSDSSPSIGTIV